MRHLRASSIEASQYRSKTSNQAGFTFVELAFGVAIIALVASILIGHLALTYSSTREHRDKVFAYTTAQSILSEIHALTESARDPNDFDLMRFDDGANTNPRLSVAEIDGVPVPPDHLNSRNISRNSKWIWSRRITVRALPGIDNRQLRYVTVVILKRDGAGIERPMAHLASVINSPTEGFPSTQEFDIFLLALENVPGWWVNMEAIRPFVESTVADLESRNPGLRFRTHWITKLSYGRNPVYRPYLNALADSEQDIPNVYFYPGRLPAGGAINNYYGSDRMAGRLLTDSGQVNGYDPDLNPYPYALSDFYNHGMRLPRERALHDLRVAGVKQRKGEIEAATRNGNPPPDSLLDMSEEPTLRLLLEDMNSDPDKYRHAMIVNLHGELVPLPPMRNYSDPAKLPRALPDVRVVTHPEQLRTGRPNGSLPGEDVVLRVYAYTTDPDNYTGPIAMPQEYSVALDVVGMDLTDGGGPNLRADVAIQNLRGGVPVGGDDTYYPFTAAKLYTDPTRQADEMGYWSELVDPGSGEEKITRIWLYHTPVIAPDVATRGLENTERSRLYGLEYIPSCTEVLTDFSRDLFALGSGPKNTARWTLTIPRTAFADRLFIDANGNYLDPGDDALLRIRTYVWDGGLADPSKVGTMYPTPIDPENLSETYTWWADSREDVPYTERSQFLGDPRHNPYKDLCDGDPDFPNGYNWYHDALDNDGEDSVADYPGLDASRLSNRWDGTIRADLPRLFQTLRGGLVSSATVYTTLTGWSYYYAGFGNEIGADAANGYPDSLPMNLRPFGQPGATGTINNITPNESGGSTGGRRFVRDGQPVPDYWWGMPWLGEHYPDRVYSTQWFAVDGDGNVSGNLMAGNGPDEFYRQVESSVHANTRFSAYGTRLDRSEQRAGGDGCKSFFNIGTSTSTFGHQGSSGTGDLVTAGIELGENYGLSLPSTTPINRPFDLTLSGAPPEFSHAPYSSERYSADLLRTYYDHSGGLTGSGLVQLVDLWNTSAGFQVVNGLAPSSELGAAEISRFSIVSMVHSLFEVGDSTLPHRIPQIPRVTISSPTEIAELVNPTSVEVQFDVQWLRWDEKKYTETTSPTFSEDESTIDYAVYFSPDNGLSWFHTVDGSPAIPGTKPGNPMHLHQDATAGPETVVWAVPAASFPEGMYTLQVEAYRRGQNLHHALHQVRAYIQR